MSRFTSTKRIDTRWRNNDFIGEPGSSHTFADALHEEFLVDWAYQIQIGDIVITETPTTGNIQMATLTVGDIVLTGTATGNFGGGGGGSGNSTIYYQTNEPSATGKNVGDLWVDSDAIISTIPITIIGTSPISASTNTSTLTSTLTISTASTSASGAVQLTDSTSSTSTTTAATPNSVKSAYDLANTSVQRDVFSLYEFGSNSVIGTLSRFTLTTSFAHTRNAVYYVRLVAHRDFTVSNISVTSSATASSALTGCRLGIYTRSGTSFTLVAQTASDTTIGNTINTKYTRALATAGGYPATYDLTEGSEYWIGLYQGWPSTGATGATWLGAASRLTSSANAATGIQVYTQTGQSDLPASGTGTESTTLNGVYLEVL
jgi:hypothetical protein